MPNANEVVLTVSTYNNIKNDNYRLNLFLDNLLLECKISEDRQHLVFNSAMVENAIRFCFPTRYKDKLSHMKTTATRTGTNIAKEETTV